MSRKVYSAPYSNENVVDLEKLIKNWKKEAMSNREAIKNKEFFKKKSVIRHEKAIQRRRSIEKEKAKMAKFSKSNY